MPRLKTHFMKATSRPEDRCSSPTTQVSWLRADPLAFPGNPSQWRFEGSFRWFRAQHSGGTAPDSHRLPRCAVPDVRTSARKRQATGKGPTLHSPRHGQETGAHIVRSEDRRTTSILRSLPGQGKAHSDGVRYTGVGNRNGGIPVGVLRGTPSEGGKQ